MKNTILRGFEVVGISLDQERDALEKFVTERKIPWPILFEPSEGSGWQHPLATYYGISGIPTVILIGRDGNVVSLNARGERLGELLDELFKDSSRARQLIFGERFFRKSTTRYFSPGSSF